MTIKIEYKKGSMNVVPDALSRREDHEIDSIYDVEKGLVDPSDWPLIVPYLVQQLDVPSGILQIN